VVPLTAVPPTLGPIVFVTRKEVPLPPHKGCIYFSFFLELLIESCGHVPPPLCIVRFWECFVSPLSTMSLCSYLKPCASTFCLLDFFSECLEDLSTGRWLSSEVERFFRPLAMAILFLMRTLRKEYFAHSYPFLGIAFPPDGAPKSS